MNRQHWTAAVIAFALTAQGCGESDPIAEIAQANAAVVQARGAVDAAQEVVTERQTEVANAQTRLAEAQSDVRTAEQELARLEAAVDRDAVDTVLFREVQKRLLEDDALSNVAIAASVKNGVVSLSGNVDNERLRDRAVQVAGQPEGVERVESRIEISVSAPPPASDTL
jgi:osmotically-inducible protein OsmY